MGLVVAGAVLELEMGRVRRFDGIPPLRPRIR
jgi:hypothetical protein